jgi:hypothetical protein
MPNLEKFIKNIHFGNLRYAIKDINNILKDETYLDKTLTQIVKRRYLYLNKKVDYSILNVLIYFMFSKNFGEVVRYFALTHPSVNQTILDIPEYFYTNIVKFCLKQKIPIIYYKDLRLQVIPRLTTRFSIELDTGLSSTLLIMENLLNHVRNRAKEEGLDITEHLDDFLMSMKDNKITDAIVRRYNIIKDKYISESRSKEVSGKISNKPRSYGIVPKVFEDLTSVPCLKKIIQRQLNGVELSHYERVVFLSIVQAFFDNNYIHKFFEYSPDYTYKDTEKYINYTRSSWPIPNNCKGIIKRDLCPCGEKGCCGTTIYAAFIMPSWVREKIEEFYKS